MEDRRARPQQHQDAEESGRSIAIQRPSVGRSPSSGPDSSDDEDRREKGDRRSLRRAAGSAAPRRSTPSRSAATPSAASCSARRRVRQKPGPALMPGERRDHQHLAGVTRPDDEEQRVVPHQILRRRVERRQAEPGEKEERQRARARAGARVGGVTGRRSRSRSHADERGHAYAASSSRSTKGRMPPCR